MTGVEILILENGNRNPAGVKSVKWAKQTWKDSRKMSLTALKISALSCAE